MLTALVLIPLVGAIVLSLIAQKEAARIGAVFFGGVSLLCSVLVLALFLGGHDYHFVLAESANWLPALGVRWSLGVDGLAAWLLVATAAMTLVAIGMAWRMTDRPKTFLALILALEGFIFGAFLSLDLVLFFTFFELTLFPVFFMIAGWGGEKRRYAATKFFAYNLPRLDPHARGDRRDGLPRPGRADLRPPPAPVPRRLRRALARRAWA